MYMHMCVWQHIEMHMYTDKPVVWAGQLVSAAVSARRHDSPAPPLALAATCHMMSAAPGSQFGCQARDLLSNRMAVKKLTINQTTRINSTAYDISYKKFVLKYYLVCVIQQRFMQLYSLSTIMQM